MQDLVLNNRYRIEKLIGQGGMADVYLGRDTLLDRLVAIKVLHPDLANDQTFIENFRREARAAAKLVHPNIVGIYDVGEDQGFHYIVLEYVPGHTLKDELEAGDLTPKQALSIALDVAEGLQEAHRHGFIHCDIKPQNILLLPSGIAKITDFGIARLTTSTSTLVFGNQDIMGTAHYLSPEQAQGRALDGRSDLYSLGIMLYEMLSGSRPYEGDNPVTVALKHVQDHPFPLSILVSHLPSELCEIVDHLLEKDPDDRYLTSGDLLNDLSKLYLSLGGETRRQPEIIYESKEPALYVTQVAPRERDTYDIEPQSISIWRKKIVLIPSLILLFIIAFSGVYFLLFDSGKKDIPVPNLTGQNTVEAVSQLKELGLQVQITESSDSQAEEGKVLSQSPPAGTLVRANRAVTIVVGKPGSGRVGVPSLVGLTRQEAEQQLRSAGLALGMVSEGWEGDKPAGIVLGQGIHSGDVVAKGSTVNITVNPASNLTLPDFKGKTLKQAQETLAALNLKAVVQDSSATGQPAGTVIDQNPAAGKGILSGGTVILNVVPGGEARSVSLSYKVPSQKTVQQVQVIRINGSKKSVLYSQAIKSGETFEKTIEAYPGETIQLYVDNQLISEEKP